MTPLRALRFYEHLISGLFVLNNHLASVANKLLEILVGTVPENYIISLWLMPGQSNLFYTSPRNSLYKLLKL